MGFRRQHTPRPLGVIGQQQQALAGLVQTADRRDKGMLAAEACIHGLAAFVVGSSCNHASRLVQHQVDLALRHSRKAVDRNLVFLQLDGRLNIVTDAAVQADASGTNQLARTRTRAISEFREGAR